ncbi:DUF4143 domain-containing protein [Microbispora sp. KK1-11]|uniref:DUF4143 domain-containing protein n=1 Tax=Microbispora sp. KK1-11 TaxID=2053005 RepID=UPI001C8D1369
MDGQAVFRDGDLLGRLLDTFVVQQLRAEVPVCDSRPRIYHLRQDQGRHEIDIVLELGMGRVIGIEVKAAATPRHDDAKHLRWLRDELGDRCHRHDEGPVPRGGDRAFVRGSRSPSGLDDAQCASARSLATRLTPSTRSSSPSAYDRRK